MKKRVLIVLVAMCMVWESVPVTVNAGEGQSVSMGELEVESEHPPLSEETKEAIAAYKKNPCEETRQGILNALNEAYDLVIEKKKENLEYHTAKRENRINAWLHTVMEGGIPPFLNLATDNQKEEARKAVADAVTAYQTEPSESTREQVLNGLNAYYDAFLEEQEVHITETEALKEQRVTAALNHFTSDNFQPQISDGEQVEQDSILAELICNYIAAGAVFLPVDPEARVREREMNAAISEAQDQYFSDPSPQNEEAVRSAVAEAFETAYEVRKNSCLSASDKGTEGGKELFEQMLSQEFLDAQYEELTEQRNLYGRIDRMITFGSNTYGGWTPRMESEPMELAVCLDNYEADSTDANLQLAQDKFYQIYEEMLQLENAHLETVQSEISEMVEQTVQQLIGSAEK